ncbi:MAG: TIGR03936 family radical SAM-associated protein [Clostridia bacterium]|nr:TIGR03936 family radical SAM-associated protein [Clostridia bacterium]
MSQNNNFYVRYKKYGRAKYISHLDMVRVFNRVFRRGSIPVAYSEGFNPHPKISFALPLSVFYESECEIMLFSVTEDITSDELFKRFSAVFPEGLEAIEVKEGKPDIKHLSYCLYNVYCSLPSQTELDAFLSLKEMIVPKKTKSGIKDTDIRRDVADIKLEEDCMSMLLSAGSNANLKPDVVIKAMNKYIEGYSSGDTEYLRKSIYTDDMVEI